MEEKRRGAPQKKRATRRLDIIRRRRIQTRRMIISISAVALLFCIVLGAQMIQKYSTLKELKEQQQELEQQYQKELALSEELKEQEAYVKTDDYVEEMARRLGLLYPDEVIFKPEQD